MNRILLYLGLNPTGFRAGLKQATDETRNFERGWKGLFKIFAAGGATTLVLGFLRSLVEQARESSDSIDSNTQAVIRFGNTWDSATKTVKSAGVTALGWVTNVMEGVGFQIGKLIYGTDAAVDAMNEMALATAKAADAERIKKLTAAEEALAKTRRDIAFQEADNEGKTNILLAEGLKLREALAKTKEGTVEHIKAQEALEKNLSEVRKANLATAKDEEQVQKQINEELEKFFGDVEKGARKRQELAARLKEIEFERLPLAQQVETLAKSESELQDKILAAKRAGKDTLQMQVDQAEIQLVLDDKRKQLADQQLTTEEKIAEIKVLTAKLIDGTITPAERDRLQVLIEQTAEMSKQAGHAKVITKNAQDQLSLLLFTMRVRGQEQFRDADDKALRELLRRNQENIRQQEFRKQIAGPLNVAASFITQSDIARMQMENENIRKELDFRSGLRRDLSIGGESMARRNFKGDPLQFDEVLQRVTGQWEKQDEANDLLRDIKTGLTNRDQTLAELPNQVRSLTAATQAVAVQLNQRGIRSS